MLPTPSEAENENDPYVYRVITPSDWATTQQVGYVPAVQVDRNDGYFHLSPHDQILKTAKLYFPPELLPAVLEFDATALGADLVWEVVPERGGRSFPHLYADTLPLSAVTAYVELTMGEDGEYRFGSRTAIGMTDRSNHRT